MATHPPKRFGEQKIKNKFKHRKVMYGDQNAGGLSSTTFTRPSRESNHEGSSNDLTTDDSRYNVETVRSSSATEDTGVQNSRVVLVQRSTLAPSSSLESSGMVYLMALLLPLLSISNFNLPASWFCAPKYLLSIIKACSHSAALRAAEIFICQMTRAYEQTRAQIRRLARDQLTRDLFATAMDIVLVVYAIGFLFLSLYQASIIG